MQKYNLRSVSLSKMVLSTEGVVKPLCDTCKTLDCGHQIEYRTVSLFGINTKMRCAINGGTPSIVIDCDGFID